MIFPRKQVDMAHKLTMTSLIKFMPVPMQMPSGMVVVVCYMFVILIGKPYLRKGAEFDPHLRHELFFVAHRR